MMKMLILGTASAAALVPAAIGLTANPSLSAKVPVPAVQVPVSSSTHSASHDANDDKGGQRVGDDTKVGDGAHRNRHSGDDDAVRRSAATSAPTRTVRVEVGDDKGGQRTATKTSDDSPTHDAGDDKGGQRGKGGGSDDKGGHGGGHGSDD